MASNRFNFTATELKTITCTAIAKGDGSGRVWVRDTKVPGLSFCVTEGGARTFYLYRRVKGKPSRIRIGTDTDLTVEQARRRAGELNSQIAQDLDPVAEKKAQRAEAAKKAATVGDLWQSYLDGHLVHKRPRSVSEFTRLYDMHLVAWKDRPVGDVTKADVEAIKTRIGKNHGHYTANRVLELLRAMYRSRGHFFGLPEDYSPTRKIEMFDEHSRERVLAPDELGRFIEAVEVEKNETIRDFFRMLLYTGARKANVAGMRWQDVSIQRSEWKIPGMLTKNGAQMAVMLVPEAVEILERRANSTPTSSPFVFPAYRLLPEQVENIRAMRAAGASTRAIGTDLDLAQTSIMRVLRADYDPGTARPFNGSCRALARILKRAKITERCTIHDLRRTFCVAMIEGGAPLPLVASAMGHKTMETTARHYGIARADPVRAAVLQGVAGMLNAANKASEAAKAKAKAG